MSTNQFSITKTVTEEHLDQMNHVNNVVYLEWVQEIAKAHWQHQVPQKIQEACLWVVISHFIEYKRPAVLGDELVIKTYVDRMEGVKSIRMVEIYRNEKLLTRAKSVWCMLDAEQLKPTRIPKEVMMLFKSHS